MMRAIPTLVVDSELVLRPAGPIHLEALVEAFEESMPEVVHGLPWYDINDEMLSQLNDYLIDVNNMGKIGRAYHWAIIDSRDDSFLGLLAFDRYTRTRRAHWNLGYWVRKSACRRGIAKRASIRCLDWISTTQGGPTAVEITVDPENTAGLATCKSLVDLFHGIRAPEGDGKVEVAGKSREHVTYILPRLPIPVSKESVQGTIWLSIDTDDLCHHPNNYGHPTRTKKKVEEEHYSMTDTLELAWKGFINWRNNAGKGIPITLFVISEQLEDERFSNHLRNLLQSDNLVTVGTHGHKHRCWSAWPKDPERFHHDLSFSISLLSRFAGDKFRPWFRAPGGYIAPWMADIISREGIILDSSINHSFLTRKKAGEKRDWQSVRSILFRKGIVERSWKTWGGIPITGPALRIPFLKLLSNYQWKKITKKSICVQENILLNQNYLVDSLYWHLLDYSRNNGTWVPPLHHTLS